VLFIAAENVEIYITIKLLKMDNKKISDKLDNLSEWKKKVDKSDKEMDKLLSLILDDLNFIKEQLKKRNSADK